MATSINDLLTAALLAARDCQERDDAAGALSWSSRLLDRVLDEGGLLLSDRPRDLVARRLSDACRYAAMSFPGRAGRASDLVAVLHDVIARQRDQLSAEDRWAIVTRTAMSARRFAGCIAHSGRYRTVPELSAVAECAREVLVLAATRPVRLERLRALDLPIPSLHLTVGASVVSAAAELVGEVSRVGREPLTMRELNATCHAGYQLAAYVALGTRTAGGAIACLAQEAARGWNRVREAVRQFHDAQAPPTQPGVFARAVEVDAAVRHALASGPVRIYAGDRQLSLATGYLGRLAGMCHENLIRLTPQLIVRVGSAPFSEQRVEDWLRRAAFVVTPPDVDPLQRQLGLIQEQALRLSATALPSRALDRTVSGPRARQVELNL